MLIKIYYAHLSPEECDSIQCIPDIQSMEVEIPSEISDIQKALDEWSARSGVTIFDWKQKRVQSESPIPGREG
ncbi:hypothetical protein [Nostoc sp. C117]|uniref:hypothetical protein n=1 Tax=Nostoc sp. C117 TaxID=3349875 RepID=UPI00370D5942